MGLWGYSAGGSLNPAPTKITINVCSSGLNMQLIAAHVPCDRLAGMYWCRSVNAVRASVQGLVSKGPPAALTVEPPEPVELNIR